MEELLTQSKEVLGIIVASAIALGAAAMPVGKFIYRHNKNNKELQSIKSKNTNQTTISMGESGNMQGQLQRMESSIEHIEAMLVLEGQVHHTQTSHLDGLRGEVSKLRDEIVELKVRVGRA